MSKISFRTLLASASAALLMVACQTTETCENPSGVGVEHTAAPGTKDDFEKNIKNSVYFGLNKYNLSPEAEKNVEAQAAWLKTYSSTGVTVEGYADKRGTDAYNLGLGKRRATSVAKKLEALGIAKDRVKTISYGKNKELVAGDTEEAYALNRVAKTVVGG